MVQSSESREEKLNQGILSFGRHIAGSCKITAECRLSDYASSQTMSKTAARALLIAEDFQPRLMNYAKRVAGSNVVLLAVDKWIFERDVDKGLLGEALAEGLIFPYKTIVNRDYLHLQEITLKKRLITELLQSLVLDFPELSYEFYIKPAYFVHETLLARARLFPPMLNSVYNLSKEERNIHQITNGFIDALRKLEEDGAVDFSNSYVRISRDFVEKARARKTRFTSLLKAGHRALFASLLGMLPQIMNAISQDRESFFNLQKILNESARAGMPFEDPESLVYVKTASGLVPLANRMDIEAFARKVLKATEGSKVEIKNIGGFLNDVYLVSVSADDGEKRVVVKRFRDWSSFKWFPLTLWSIGTRTFAVRASSRLERECAINRLLHSKGFAVPELFYVSPNERLIFMEYIEGENLSKLVRRFSESKNDVGLIEFLRIIESAGELLAKAHTLGVALGDAKPENILVDERAGLCLTDLEQASRGGDKTWDIAEFLYYAGHDFSPFVSVHRVELIAKAFIAGYLRAGGNIKLVNSAGNPKYTKVFSVFTFPHIMLATSNICRKAEKLNEQVSPKDDPNLVVRT